MCLAAVKARSEGKPKQDVRLDFDVRPMRSDIDLKRSL
jgi:hypothetical protein